VRSWRLRGRAAVTSVLSRVAGLPDPRAILRPYLYETLKGTWARTSKRSSSGDSVNKVG
jgi:hypothetical protein